MPLKLQTDMNSDTPYESAVQTSLIPLHGQRSWGQSPSPLWKVEDGKTYLPPSPFLALNLRKKHFFYFSMEIYIVQLAKALRV